MVKVKIEPIVWEQLQHWSAVTATTPIGEYRIAPSRSKFSIWHIYFEGKDVGIETSLDEAKLMAQEHYAGLRQKSEN